MVPDIPIPLERRYTEFADFWKRAVKKQSKGAIHDFRTACRRLLAALELVQGLIRLQQIEELSARINKALKAVGGMRDSQVQQRTVEGFDDPGRFEDFQKYLKKIERREGKRIERKLTSRRRKKIRSGIRDLERILEETVAAVDPEVVRETVEKNIQAAEDVISQRTKSGFRRSDSETLHHLRIRIKGLRYMLEIVQPQRNIEQLRVLQRQMGELHDLSELDQVVSEWAKDEGLRGSDTVKALHAEIRRRRLHGLRRLRST